VRLRAPLDWAAVTDHAEYIGEMYSTLKRRRPGSDNEQVKQLRASRSLEEREEWFLNFVVKPNRGTPATRRSMPARRRRLAAGRKFCAAQQHNQPGRFTTIRPSSERRAQGGNLHRNVFFATRRAGTSDDYIDIGRRTASGVDGGARERA